MVDLFFSMVTLFSLNNTKAIIAANNVLEGLGSHFLVGQYAKWTLYRITFDHSQIFVFLIVFGWKIDFFLYVHRQLISSTLSCIFYNVFFPFLLPDNMFYTLWSLFYFLFYFVVKHIHFNLDNRRISFFFVILNIIHFIQYPYKIPQKALENKNKVE